MKILFIISLVALFYFPVFTQQGNAFQPGPDIPHFASVFDFGAKGDGITDDTEAIQRAIDVCSANGTKLVFPAGTFMTGAVFLRSNISIELSAKAVWKAIGKTELFPVQYPVRQDGSQMLSWSAMIFGKDIENVRISGNGVIDGSGNHPAFGTSRGDKQRPFGIWIIRGRNISMEGFHLRNTAFWGMHFDECDHLKLTGLNLYNHSNLNNDGIDISDCHDVIISDCVIDSSDGGILEDIVIQNVVMDGVETPISIKLGDRWVRGHNMPTSILGAEAPGVVRNIFISNVIARNSGPIPSLITGYPDHYVENIKLSDIFIEVEGGLPAHDVIVPENSSAYPVNRMFGLKNPAYGFFIRNVKNVQLRNVQMVTQNPDDRRAIIFENATGIIENIDIENSGGQGRPSLLVDNTEALTLRGDNSGVTKQAGTVADDFAKSLEGAKPFDFEILPQTIKDYDGNQYKSLKIGNQVWMASNLKTTHYNDGKPVPLVEDNFTWSALSTPGYSWHENNIENKEAFGSLYNWQAVSSGNLCPEGWHIPTDTEWRSLASFMDSQGRADRALLDKAGFDNIGVLRHTDGRFVDMVRYNYWWISHEGGNLFFLAPGRWLLFRLNSQAERQ